MSEENTYRVQPTLSRLLIRVILSIISLLGALASLEPAEPGAPLGSRWQGPHGHHVYLCTLSTITTPLSHLVLTLSYARDYLHHTPRPLHSSFLGTILRGSAATFVTVASMHYWLPLGNHSWAESPVEHVFIYMMHYGNPIIMATEFCFPGQVPTSFIDGIMLMIPTYSYVIMLYYRWVTRGRFPYPFMNRGPRDQIQPIWPLLVVIFGSTVFACIYAGLAGVLQRFVNRRERLRTKKMD